MNDKPCLKYDIIQYDNRYGWHGTIISSNNFKFATLRSVIKSMTENFNVLDIFNN